MNKSIGQFIYKDLSTLKEKKRDESNLLNNNYDNSDFSNKKELSDFDLGNSQNDKSAHAYFELDNNDTYIDFYNKKGLISDDLDDSGNLYNNDFLSKANDSNFHTSENQDAKIHEKYEERIERVKKESYDLGYEDCKTYMEKIIAEYKINNQIVETLNNKVQEIHILEDRTEELFHFCVDVLKLIASRLYMNVSSDFAKLLMEGLFRHVKKNFNGNKIEVVVHPSKVGYSNNMIQTENLPEKIKNHIFITGEEGLELDDCYIKYENTVLKYDRLSIEKEIDEVLARL